MTYTMSHDPDDWDEEEWTRRLALHCDRYNIKNREMQVVEAVNRGVVTIDHEGGLVVLDDDFAIVALMEAQFHEDPK